MLMNLVRKLRRHVASIPAAVAHHAISVKPIESRLFASYLKMKCANMQKLPNLSVIESEIAIGLQQEGVFITSLAVLGLDGTSEMFAAGLELSNKNAGIPSNKGETMNYRPLIKWGVEPTLLRIAEQYLGLPAAYDGPKVTYTPADGRQAGTRLWHRDREDRRMMKVAIYLNDVTEDGGPLQSVKRHVFEGPLDRDFSHPILSDEKLEQRLGRKINPEDITSCTGPAGTVIFMDTARLFHRGKPAISVDRRAVFHSYFSRTPRQPFFCERSDLSRIQLMQLASNLPPEQRESILWREALPAYIRLIPKSLI